MADDSVFPLILTVRDDGLEGALNGFEQHIIASAARAGGAFDSLNRRVGQLRSSIEGRIADPLGIQAVLPAVQRGVEQQISAAQRLREAQAAGSAERVQQIQREFDAAIASIRGQQQAQTASLQLAGRDGANLVALQQQRSAEMARAVAAPTSTPGIYFDPAGAQAAAAAARQQATELSRVAAAAEEVAADTARATSSDRALAAASREAATAASIEAERREELAATHAKVAAAASAAGTKIASAGQLAATGARNNSLTTIMAAQQAQDFLIQVQGGQNVLVAFSQQASQLAVVMATAGGAAGGFASFIAGPWGTLILAGVTIAGIFATKLGDAEKAAKLAEVGASGLADAQSVLGNMFDLTSGKLEHQNELLRLNARLTAINLRSEALREANSSRDTFDAAGRVSVGDRLKAAGGTYFTTGDTTLAAAAAVNGTDQGALNARGLSRVIAGIRAGKIKPENALRSSERLDFSGTKTTREQFQQAIVDAASSQAKSKIADLVDKSLDDGKLAAGLRREGPKGSDRTKEVQSLQEFGRDYADKIASISAPFTEQPKLVQQQGKALRELADITDDLTRKNDRLIALTGKGIPGVAKLLAATAEAQRTVSDAPVAAINRQTTGLEDQVAVQRQLAAGHLDEAEQLQAKLGILRQIGITLGEEPPAVAAALQKYEQQRALLAQLRLDTRFTADQKQADSEAEALRAEIAGRQDLADLIRRQAQYEADGRKLGPEQLRQLGDRLALEQQLTREAERRSLIVNAQVDAARRLQGAFQSFFEDPFAKGAGRQLSDSITKSRQQQVAEQLSIKLFGGDLGSRVHEALARSSAPLITAADRHIAAASALTGAAGAITAAVQRAANDNPSLTQQATTPSAYGLSSGGPRLDDVNGDIVITGSRPSRPHATIDSPGLVAARAVVDRVDAPLVDLGKVQLQHLTQLRAQTAALSLAAQAIGGKGGAAINAYLNAGVYADVGKQIADQVGGKLGKSLGGAAAGYGTGQAYGALYDLIGIKGASKGAEIGGTIGGLTGDPRIAAAGAQLGGLISSLFYKAPKASAGLTIDNGVFSATSATGTDKKAIAAANSLAGSVASGLQSIADQLGGIVGGATDVQIGTYKGQLRVNDHGGAIGGVKGSGAISFDTEQAAISYAIQDAIKDGVITGLRAGTQNLLRTGTDLDRQIQKALQFEGVFTQLKQLKDPIGAAKDAIDKEFTNLRAIFLEAGASAADSAQLEELYALKRADAVKQAQEQVTGQLQSLLDDLNYKGDSGLSLRTRETNAMTDLAPLIAEIMQGKAVDQGKFTDTARSYLDIERQLYGSTSPYFEALSKITDLTNRAVTNTGAGANVVAFSDAVAQAAQAASDAAVQSVTSFSIPEDRVAMMTAGQFTSAVSAGLEPQTQALAAELRTVAANVNLLTKVASQNGAFALSIGDDASGLARVSALRNA